MNGPTSNSMQQGMDLCEWLGIAGVICVAVAVAVASVLVILIGGIVGYVTQPGATLPETPRLSVNDAHRMHTSVHTIPTQRVEAPIRIIVTRRDVERMVELIKYDVQNHGGRVVEQVNESVSIDRVNVLWLVAPEGYVDRLLPMSHHGAIYGIPGYLTVSRFAFNNEKKADPHHVTDWVQSVMNGPDPAISSRAPDTEFMVSVDRQPFDRPALKSTMVYAGTALLLGLLIGAILLAISMSDTDRKRRQS